MQIVGILRVKTPDTAIVLQFENDIYSTISFETGAGF